MTLLICAVILSLVIGFYIGRRFENRVVVTAFNMMFKNKKEKNMIMKEIRKRVKRINRETKSI